MATTPKLELPPTTNLAGVNDDADSTVEVGADRDQRLLDEKKVLISLKIQEPGVLRSSMLKYPEDV